MAKLLSGTRVYGTATVDTNLSVGANCSFNSGFGSAAVAYGCRAWVSYKGTATVAVNASGNISSVTRNGIGDYTLNFTTAMPDTSYCVSAIIGDVAGGTVNARILASAITAAPTLMSTTQVRLVVYATNDIYTFNAAVIR